MDSHLEYITGWFRNLSITVNEEKLKRQLTIISTWFKRNCRGVLEAVTGFGKTYVAIIAIHRLNLKYPEATITVIVPSTKLYNDWIDHISTFDLKNVTVYVVNSYAQQYITTKVRYKCTLLVCDEVHRYLNTTGKLFNKTISCTDFNMFLGLTATLEQEERDTLQEMGIPIVDVVSLAEAKRNNYIADYRIYNLGVRIRPELQEIYDRFNDIYNSSYARFQYFVDRDMNQQLIIACTAGKTVSVRIGNDTKTGEEWRTWYALEMGWEGKDDGDMWSPKSLSKYAHQLHWAMMERKKFIYNSLDKIKTAKEIISRFDVPTITFAETIEFVDELVNVVGSKARAYHSKIKTEPIFAKHLIEKNAKYVKPFMRKNNGNYVGFNHETGKHIIEYEKKVKISQKDYKQKIIGNFETGKFNVLCTAKALDEGFNVEGIELAIICAATGKQRARIQRMGRALRFKPDKIARVVNVYLKDTQDEVWLKRSQKDQVGVQWINSIDEIE